MRQGDPPGADFGALRQLRAPSDRVQVGFGHVLVSGPPLALAAVVTSTVAVTLYDPHSARGGMCHFLQPRVPPGAPATPVFAAPALAALLRAFSDAAPERLSAGVYGGACPRWASLEQAETARENVRAARELLGRRGVAIADEDVGGERGRRVGYLTSTNEVAVLKTDAVRQGDWFPALPGGRRA